MTAFAPPTSANAARGGLIGSGQEAATPATSGSALTACTMGVRVSSFAMPTITVSIVRMPESSTAAASALRRNTDAEISSSADTLT